MRPNRKLVAVFAAGIALLSAGAVIGALFMHVKPWPYGLLAAPYRLIRPTPDQVLTRVHSKFLDLKVEEFQPPPPVKDTGGGLSPYGENALLVTGEGQLFLLEVDRLQMTSLAIELPPNGRSALHAIKRFGEQPEYVKYRWHRYTDIVYHDDVLYLMYSYFNPQHECFTSRLSRLRLTRPIRQLSSKAADWELIFETKPCFGFQAINPYAGHQAGGRLALAPDAKLYFTVGDYHFDGNPGMSYPQNEHASYGKIFVFDMATEQVKMFSLGHRNNQGIIVSTEGDIWSTEHGPEGGDELNLIIEGGNYGWPLETYGTDYGTRIWPLAHKQGRHDRFRPPSWAWVPSIGVSNLAFVDEVIHEAWEGNLLVASLVDGAIHRVVTDGPQVRTIERIEVGERLRDLIVHAGGLIAYTDQGHVFRLTPLEDPPSPRLVELQASLSDRALAELGRCLECHGRTRSDKAPYLCGLLGRPIGASGFEHYSDALASRGGTWDEDLLRRFLADAQAVVPGIRMPDPAISDPAMRQEITLSLDFFCAIPPGTEKE